jgi:hypothetical protein
VNEEIWRDEMGENVMFHRDFCGNFCGTTWGAALTICGGIDWGVFASTGYSKSFKSCLWGVLGLYFRNTIEVDCEYCDVWVSTFGKYSAFFIIAFSNWRTLPAKSLSLSNNQPFISLVNNEKNSVY